MEYPHSARQWRTPSVETADGGVPLSTAELSGSSPFFRNYNEQTESRGELARGRRADPELTEEILSDAHATTSASSHDSFAGLRRDTVKSRPECIVGANEQLPGYGHAALLDTTHPITLNRAASSYASEIRIDLADSDDNSAELVNLVVKTEPHRTSVAPGEVLAGRYVIVERVNHRGMGLVFKALDRRRERAGSPLPWVALKFASLDGKSSSATSPYLRQEFLKLSQLNHANVVSVFDFDNDGGLDFIVMEWLEGETLANLLMHKTSKRIALDKAEEIITSVGNALAHAHGAGIVHGDVKPSNIFLTDNRTVKLLDFGSSGQTTTADGEIEPHWATRAYASCEVLQGNTPRPHDDVFALGVTAFCLLSGERPFGDLDAAEARERGIEANRLPPDAQEFWHAIRRALKVDAAERPTTAKEFMLDFCEPPTEAGVAEERPPLEHLAYGAIAVALLIAIVALTVGSIAGGVSSPEEVALDNAEEAMDAGRLVEPGEESAFAWYSSVLATLPENGEALDGLNRIAEEYLTRARAALTADDPAAAVSHLATASLVRPGHYGIAIVEDLVARHGKDLLVRARQMAVSDLDQAESLLARAATFLPVEDAALASTRDEFAQQRIDERLESLLTGIDERILSERLTIPRGDSALDLLGEARQLKPDDRLVKLAADRIATALLFQSMFAISSGTLEEAQGFIDAAKALNVKHLALARAQYELAKARHELVRTHGSGSE